MNNPLSKYIRKVILEAWPEPGNFDPVRPEDLMDSDDEIVTPPAALSTTHAEPSKPAEEDDVSARVISTEHMDVKKLPPTLLPALRAIGYNKPSIAVETTKGYYLTGSSGDGTRNIAVAVNLATGAFKVELGSWGGANPFEKRQVDMDEKVRPIPTNFAIIKGTNQGSKTLFARILVSPENMQKMLPASSGEAEEISEQEKLVLGIIGGIKSSYRREYFDRKNLGPYASSNPLLQDMQKKGWIKISGVGIQITTSGKNMREKHKVSL